ncbi:enoyl-CoA hydratase/carnithine racemase [Paenarthrobacter nicotinovorans]|uniref:enoyl-CoA hydratase/isomerase family protein n=1 Tax=Micrococcaceae TaxID=1268 RepID=UPI000876D54D|nr:MULTISPECIES: enoyl-CoA hydratase/isomerase family protein [Micrococcaceae]MDR6435049.1 enoyl-CoA hydratase/carnithine racemase [Paenarthrobacter nicotinovorans]SCZ58993.1 Enoyl-CoA hydratase/carnithine racemase [Arthrobacter sp. UNCCL28]
MTVMSPAATARPEVSRAISLSVADGVATVEISNLSQRNALTRAMCREIQELMPRLDADPDVAVVVLRGAGNTFCAGAAISELASVLIDPQEDGSTVDHLSAADAAIAAVSKPTVALVEGACMGGGWQLASACDFIIANERAIIGLTPAKIGIIYPRLGLERLVRQVGHAKAKYILLTGQTFSATEARALGLVADVVPSESFEEKCAALVSTLRSRSRFSVHAMKRLVDLTDLADVPGSSLAVIEQEWAEAWSAMPDSPDMGIGIQAFLTREQPQFRWQPGA